MSTKLSKLPPDLLAATRPKQPPRQPGRFKQCDVCGQWFDATNLEHVFHHDERPHLMLPRPPERRH